MNEKLCRWIPTEFLWIPRIPRFSKIFKRNLLNFIGIPYIFYSKLNCEKVPSIISPSNQEVRKIGRGKYQTKPWNIPSWFPCTLQNRSQEKRGKFSYIHNSQFFQHHSTWQQQQHQHLGIEWAPTQKMYKKIKIIYFFNQYLRKILNSNI